MNPTHPDLAIAIVAVTIVFLLLSSSVVFYGFVYEKRKKQHSEEMTTLKLIYDKNILQTQIEIQEQTLKNISQEIHDNIGQVLSLAKLNLNTFALTADAASITKLKDTKELVTKALHDLRDLSRSLHGDRIAELGLQESLKAELKIIENTGHFFTALNLEGVQYKLDPQKEMVLFRIVQEALSNAIKHSKAKNIAVSLKYHPSQFNLLIIDDGIGFNPATLRPSETGIGLKNMQNRAALIGAKFLVDSNSGSGTRINIELQQPSPSALI